jgi:hypothetical protein
MKVTLLYRHRRQIGSLITVEVRNGQRHAKRTASTPALYASGRRGFASEWKQQRKKQPDHTGSGCRSLSALPFFVC